MPAVSAADQIEYLLERERFERDAAARSMTTVARDAHMIIAERYADEAWLIGEGEGVAYVPSDLWRSVRG